MANPRISMRKIKDVLRLRHTAGLSYRQIAASLHIAYGAVVGYLHRAQKAGFTWPLPEGMSEEELEHRLFGGRKAATPAPRSAPEFATLHQELQRKGVTLQLLWEEYRTSSAGPHYSYAQFCARYRAWRQTLNRSVVAPLTGSLQLPVLCPLIASWEPGPCVHTTPTQRRGAATAQNTHSVLLVLPRVYWMAVYRRTGPFVSNQ